MQVVSVSSGLIVSNIDFNLIIIADGWTTADLIYIWKEVDPVQIVKDLNLPRFKLEQFQTTYCNTVTNTGAYSCLKVVLVFKREFSYYLLTIYVPSCMLVIVSWVSFWLANRSVPARVALGVTTLLTMSTQVSPDYHAPFDPLYTFFGY